MTAKSTRGPSAANGEDPVSPMNLVTDLPRRQLAMLSQSASTLYRSSESLRQIQQEAAQRASQQHQQAADKLRDARDFGEVMAIQAELLRFNMQESAQFWQRLATAVLTLQSEMISGAGRALEPANDPTLDALQRAFAATLNGSATEAATH
jgi:hypothetical protein